MRTIPAFFSYPIINLIKNQNPMKKFYITLLMNIITLQFVVAQINVTGTVLDQEKHPLPGVNIAEKGTTSGTITALNGTFKLECNNNATLVISLVGYAKQEIKITDQTNLNIILIEGIDLNGIEVVGSRSPKRTAIETPVAIDIIDMKQLSINLGQTDINQILEFAAPSFNAGKQSGADGADHIIPASLRGLGPDQTLVLVNGKRYHQSSLITTLGTRGRGNTGTDLNSIPASAIERIEVLRDGASAQYGSDAIAGVINIVLKSSVEELTVDVSSGAYNAKPPTKFDVISNKKYDGESFHIGTNYGIKAFEKGFVNFSTDYETIAGTNRPVNPAKFDIYRRQFGDGASNNLAFYINSNLPLSDKTRFYASGGFNYRFTDAYAWTRVPDENRNVIAIYPNGFDPQITSAIGDQTFSAGIKTKAGEWDLDINNSFGQNRFHYIIANTLNSSLLEKSPTRFDAGGHQFSQNTTGIYLSRFFNNILNGFNLAVGMEYRLDNYKIFAGEEASYRNYGIVDSVGANGFIYKTDTLHRAAGSQGFPGFQPSNVVDESRTNMAAYVDGELDITKKFMIGGAMRFEHYSDFGNTTNVKLATRLAFSKNISLRASISTGFRAPSLAQIYYNIIFTDVVAGKITDKIIARNNSPITRALGIAPLKQEEALNGSLGLTAHLGNFTATVDGYYVSISNRVVLTGAFQDTDPDIGNDLKKLNVGAAQFFTNAIDTKSIGVDAVLTYNQMLGRQKIGISLAANFNNMTLGRVKTNSKLAGKEDIYFGSREKAFLLASAPPSKISLNLEYNLKRFGVNARITNFGEVTLEDWNNDPNIYKAVTTLDLTLHLNATKNITLSIGANNILNTYPTQQDPTLTEGGGLWDAVQMGCNGAYYFSKLTLTF
jgi:iron complex outermembrane receptor protein